MGAVIILFIYAIIGLILSGLAKDGWGVATFFCSLLLSPLVGLGLVILSHIIGEDSK